MSSVRPVNIAQLRAEFERRPDGSLLVTNPELLGPYPGRMGAHFEHWSRAAPDRTMIAEREHGGAWRSLSYAEAMQQVRAIAQGLLARDLSAGRPVMILSDNSIAHLLVALACLHVGVPYLTGIAGLFAARHGFREVTAMRRVAHSRPRVRRGRSADSRLRSRP